jgi:ParB family chromosome partitioning protein
MPQVGAASATDKQSPVFPALVADDRHHDGRPMVRLAGEGEHSTTQDIPPAPVQEPSGPATPQLDAINPSDRKREWGINRASGAALSKLTESLAVENELKAAKERLEAGQVIVDLDPQLLDSSFVRDRMDISDDAIDELAALMKEQGQIVPILVRPHPTDAERYQIAYGHRRAKAAERLGIKVKATIRKLTDEELVIAQGQENNARVDLTFIERARFFIALNSKGFKRKVIREALSVNEGDLSSLIAVGSRIPMDIIDAIGPAPAIGRPRWRTLMDLLQEQSAVKRARQALGEDEIKALPSDERFRVVIDRLQKKEVPKAETWEDPKGRPLANIIFTDTKCTLRIDQRQEPEFAKFLVSRLSDIYRAYEQQKA